MPRFYFHLEMCNGIYPDEEGRDLPDVEHARANAISLHTETIEPAKKPQAPDAGAEENADTSQLAPDSSGNTDDNAQLPEVQVVPVPDAVHGTSYVAWKPLAETTCTQ